MLNSQTLEIAKLLDMLPDEDIALINAIVKKLVIAWDPDFTKLLDTERAIMQKTDAELLQGIYVKEDDIWN